MPLHFKKLIYPAIDLSKNALKRISLKMCKLSENKVNFSLSNNFLLRNWKFDETFCSKTSSQKEYF